MGCVAQMLGLGNPSPEESQAVASEVFGGTDAAELAT